MRKRWYLLVSCSVCFILGVSMVIPIFNDKRSAIDIFNSFFDSPSFTSVGDEISDTNGTVVSGLQFEDVDIYWTETGATLINNYTDIDLSAKQIFVPDELSDLTEHFTYDLQEWHDTKARFWVTLTYLPYTHVDYGSLNLNNLLGNLPHQDPVSFDDAVNFTVWDYVHVVLYNVGDIVFYDDVYYLCKQQIYNYNGLPSSLPQYWEETEESEGSIFPSNQFQISNKEVWASNRTDRGYVCDITDFTDEETGFNVSWGITVRSHYYHIIIDYNLYYTNYTIDTNGSINESSFLVASFQDIYSGEKPDLLPIDYNVEKLQLNSRIIDFNLECDLVDRATLIYDNRYGESHSVNVTVAYPKNETLLGFYADDIDFEYQDDLYNDVKTKAIDSGLTGTLVDETFFSFHSYKVNVSGDCIETFYFDIDANSGGSNRLHMWVTGSWGGGGGESGSWGDSDWLYRKNITINSSQVPSTLTNFPVLINLTDTDLRDNANSNGSDILFTNITGTKLNHEIELFNSTTGQLIAWVNVTSLSSSVDTVIYIYYGNAGASNQENVEGTWDSNYMLVSHMKDSSDSTSNNNDISQTVGDPSIDTGKIGNCYYYDGDDSHKISDSASLSALDPVTYEFWGKSDTGGGDYFRLLEKHGASGGYANEFLIFYDEGVNDATYEWGIQLYDGSDALKYSWDTGCGSMPESWVYYGVSYNGGTASEIVLIKNTSEVDDTSKDIGAWNGVGDTSDDLWIGSRAGSTEFFTGYMDEVRVSNCVRSSDYLKTTYNSINNATDGGFFTVGSQETESVDTPPSPPTSFTATTYNSTQINLTWTKGTEATHTYIEGTNLGPVWNRGDRTEIYNNTGTSYSHTVLDPDITYFYQAWSYNSTSGLWNETYASASNTTEALVREWNTIQSGWFNFNTEDRTYQTIDSGWFTFDTEDRSWQTIQSGWFTFDTSDRTFQTVDSGYFTFDTVDRTFQTIDSGWFNFDTIDRDWSTIESGWFTFDTTDRTYQTISSGYFSFDTIDRDWSTVDSGYFTFDTADRAWQTITSGWFNFDTESRVWNTIQSGWFNFNTVDRTFQTIDSGWFNFDTIDRDWSTIESGWFTFDTVDRTYQTISSGWFTFDTSDRSYQTIQSGWFTFDTVDRTYQTISSGWFTFDTSDRSYQTIQSGWFTFDTSSRIYQTIDGGYFVFDTTDRSWNNIQSGWFSFTTTDRSWQTIDSGWFSFDTVDRTWNTISSGWFTFDTTDRTYQTISSGWFTFDTSDRSYQTIQSGWFTFDTSSRIYQTIDSGWFNFNTGTRNIQTIQTGWFNFDTIDRDWSTIESGWFTFDTVLIHNFILTNITPANNSLNIPLQPGLFFTINNTKGYKMNVTIYYSTNQSNVSTFLKAYTNISNSTIGILLNHANTRYTTYYWRIYANDSIKPMTEIYNFKTEHGAIPGYIPTNNNIYIGVLIGVIALISLMIIIKKKRDE